jgi:hypothetical protein
MEQKKFRLKLNLFDGLVLVLAVAVGAFLLWNALKPQTVSDGGETTESSAATIRYSILFRRWPEGNDALIAVGDQMTDAVKNANLGTVVDMEVLPSQSLVLDEENGRYILSDAPTYEDILVTMEATGTYSEEAVTLTEGYVLRVGATAYLRGPGYMASGPIYAIEREDAK